MQNKYLAHFNLIRQKILHHHSPDVSGVLILLFFSIFMFVEVCQAPIARNGDGFEYLYMTQSIQSHGNPKLTGKDIKDLAACRSEVLGKRDEVVN